MPLKACLCFPFTSLTIELRRDQGNANQDIARENKNIRTNICA